MKILLGFSHQLQTLVQQWNKLWWHWETIQVRQPQRNRSGAGNLILPIVCLLIAAIALTNVMGYHFYNEPQLDVGKAAPQTILAPASAMVEDTTTTEIRRKDARSGAVPVLMVDQAINQQIEQDLQELLNQGYDLRRLLGPFPFVPLSVLSTSSQLYLRSATDQEWQVILQELDQLPQFSPSNLTSGITPLNANQRQVLEELRYHQATASSPLPTLLETLVRARRKFPTARAALEDPIIPVAERVYDTSLFNLPDPVWQATQAGLRRVTHQILTQGIYPGMSPEVMQAAIKVHLDGIISTEATPLATKVLLQVLQVNLVKDPEQTLLRAEQAAKEVKPVLVTVRQGEVIVRTGEVINQSAFVLLDHFHLSRRGVNWSGLTGFGLVVTASIGIFELIKRQFHLELRKRDYLLLWLLTLSAPLPVILGFPSTTLLVIGLLVGSFYGPALGVALVGLLSLLLPLGIEIGWSHLLANALGGVMGALFAGRLRSREELAFLGGTVALVQGAVYLVLNTSIGPVWHIVLKAAALHTLIGLAWSIIALGLSPYLEHLFDLVTPIRLAELANPNCPLLKRLAAETPGTFQHTLFVATLAEAAARTLGCNVELVRAGTLYHDIGKMHDPRGFIENQMGGPNKHDLIDDPWISAAIIKKHVTEGLVMARKSRLPKAIQAFIPEHQGTMLIGYFYHQAQQRSQQSPLLTLNETDFRYDGPIPQSRETGIVMLADSCEAALRSLQTTCPEEALGMINKILRARWQDQQLVDSGLTRSEMTQIAQIFVQVWQQFNHQRIAYPQAISAH